LLANRADVQDAWLFVKQEMNHVYNMVDAAPFVDLPDISIDAALGRLHGFKLIAERLEPSKLPVIARIEKILLDNHLGKISDKKAFFELKPLAEKYGLDPGLVNRIERKIRVSRPVHSLHYDWKSTGAQGLNAFKIKPFKMPQGLKLGNVPAMRKKQGKALAPGFNAISAMFGGRK
jgi:hypothetical protein